MLCRSPITMGRTSFSEPARMITHSKPLLTKTAGQHRGSGHCYLGLPCFAPLHHVSWWIRTNPVQTASANRNQLPSVKLVSFWTPVTSSFFTYKMWPGTYTIPSKTPGGWGGELTTCWIGFNSTEIKRCVINRYVCHHNLREITLTLTLPAIA